VCVCVCVCVCVFFFYQVIFARVLPVNFIPYSVNVVNTAKLVLLKVGF